MSRLTRTAIVAVATLAASAGAAPTAAHAGGGGDLGIESYEDLGLVRLGDGDGSVTDEIMGLVSDALGAAGGCVPKKYGTTIYEPAAHVYYGLVDSVYVWEGLAEATIDRCSNPVHIRVHLVDQPLNGVDAPATGPIAEGSGNGRAGAVATVTQRYNNVALAAGFSYHQITTFAAATQTDGRTTVAWCGKRTWVYRATLTGPSLVGSTPTETVQCGA